MEHCSDHAQMMCDVAVIKTTVINLDTRINGSINSIEKHMERGTAWRIAIIGNALLIVMQLVGFAYLWGQASKQIQVNTLWIQEHRNVK